MNPVALLAPLFFAFEFWQIYVGERHLGIKQIRANANPRELPLPAWMPPFWAGSLIIYYCWMVLLLLHPVGRVQGVIMLLTSVAGYSLRASTTMKWTLVILTFECAIRIGMLISLLGLLWRQLR